MNEQFFLNQGNGCCPQIPSRYSNYLEKTKYLSEFSTETDKQIVRCNLGIDEIINQLVTLINAKVIERGNIAWDLIPTQGHFEQVLSSNALYNTLLNYALKSELDNNIQQIWTNTVGKINETYNTIEGELNELREYLDQQIEEVECEFRNFRTSVNQSIDSIREDVEDFKTETSEQIDTLNNNFNRTTRELTELVNTTKEDLISQVNTTKQEMINQVNQTKQEMINSVNTTKQEMITYVNSSVSQLTTNVNNQISKISSDFQKLTRLVNSLETTLYNKLYQKLSKDLYNPLEKKVDNLSQLIKSFIKTSGGTALSNQFGNDDYIGVSQKTLTQALNNIWSKIEAITGEVSQGINMIVSPTYFIGEDACTVNISAISIETGMFEHIEFYANDVLIDQADNVETFTCSTEITDTTVIKCVARILGINYEKSKIVTRYNNFFLLAGQFDSNEDLMEYITNHPEYSISLNKGLRSNHDVECQDEDHIIIVMGKSLANGFMRADLNGLEIPFDSEDITINDEEFTIFTSINKYTKGIYNIDING